MSETTTQAVKSAPAESSDPVVLLADNQRLQGEVAELKHQVAMLQKLFFGPKSEKLAAVDNPHQMALGEEFAAPPALAPETETITYERGKGPKVRPEDCVSDSGLRFNPSVPVRTIPLPVPEIDGLDADAYEIIDTKVTHRLAQRPASYVVLRYERPVVKLRDKDVIITQSAPTNVLERSVADVSFLTGLLVDKFLFHLPLYRQHQRLEAAGVTLARSTLTNLVARASELLKPIVDAQLDHVLSSRVLAMDETPIKAGKSKTKKGRMHQGYYWPLYGEDHEVVFGYASSRGRHVIESMLRDRFSGTLLSDGYKAYASYVARTEGTTHAQCWVHTRRQFVDAAEVEPDAVNQILQQMAVLFKVEADIRQEALEGEKKRHYRLEHSKPVVDGIFEWAEDQIQRTVLLPTSPFTKALHYLNSRAIELRVFLEEPDVALDTNHLERALRSIPMGRRNWLFCWSEIGAEHVGTIQSLITTCKLQGVNPSIYLTDVLQRISIHPNKQILELTPRLWKERFADQALTSDLEWSG